MRISDWSSDVCSSDLLDFFRAQFRIALERIYDVENLQSGSIQIEPPRDIEFPIAEDVLERDVVGYVERSRIDHALRFETKEKRRAGRELSLAPSLPLVEQHRHLPGERWEESGVGKKGG